MTFLCECGFQTDLSSKQRERLAASGGRVKCPKCGKSSTLAIPSEVSIEQPEPSVTHESEIEDLLGLVGASLSNERSQQRDESAESATTVAPTKDAAIVRGKSRSRTVTKDAVLFGAIGFNLFLSLLAFGFPLSRVEDVLKLQKRVAELESELDHKDEDILKMVGKALDVIGPHTAEKCRSLSIIDASGKTRMLLFSDDSTIGTGIEIADDKGKPRVQIRLDKDGQSLVRHLDRNGVVRAGSGVIFSDSFKEGIGAFTTFDSEGKLVLPNR